MDRRTLRSKKAKPHNTRPYDRQNQSIFGKVCSKVKGLLNPTWLFSQWTSNSEEEQPGCSTDGVEETVREDNDVVSQSVSHGNKRLRLRFDDHIPSIQSSATQTWSEQIATQPLFDSVISELNPRVPTSSQSSLLENKETIPVLNGDDHSENSEGSASTSGCSSLVSSHKDINRLVESPFQSMRTGIKSRISQRESAASKSGLSVAADLNSSRPLWSSGCSPPATFQRRLSNTNQPNFNLSTFMGPSKLDKMEKKSSSPFYKGKTTFGGASALRRMPSSVTPYQVDKTLRNQIKIRESQSEDGLEGMSSAAKRILLTLEKMSSPVTDAKKMPNTNTSPVDLSLYLKPPRCRRNSQFTPSVSSKGPPIADISTIAKLATLKNYGVNRLRNSVMTSPVTSSEQKTPLHNILQPSSSETNIQKSGGGKIKNKLNQHHHSSKSFTNSESEVLNEPSLPSIPLPISSLPQFTFGSKSEKLEKQSPSGNFTFSNPIEHEVINEVTTSSLSQKSFKFSNPIEHELPNTTLPTTENVTLPLSNTAKTIPTSSTWECSECWVQNPASKASCMACETPRISKSKGNKLNHCESKLVTASTSASTSISFSPVLKFSSTTSSVGQFNFGTSKNEPQDSKKLTETWECKACWVRSPENKSKCIACETPRLEMENTNSGVDCNSFVPVSSIASETWECQTCLVRSPNKESKCIACETPRSTENNASVKTSTVIPTSTWECSSCWVRNPMTENKCLACETLHPNKDTIAGSTGTTGFKFNSPIQNSSITFKFGSFVATVPATSTTSSFKFGTADPKPQPVTTTSMFKFAASSSSAVSTVFTASDSLANNKTPEMPNTNTASVFKIPFGSEASQQSESKPSTIEKSQADDKQNSKVITPLNDKDAGCVSTPTSTISENTISKQKEITPSVTSCFGFSTQPILDSKKSSEIFSFGICKENSNSSSSSPVFGNFPASSSNKDKPIETGELVKLGAKNQKENANNKLSTPVACQSQPSISAFTVPLTTTSTFKFGEKIETSKATASTTMPSVCSLTSEYVTKDQNDNSVSKPSVMFQSPSQAQPVTSAFTLPSSTASLKFNEKTESLKTVLSGASVALTTTTPSFSFTTTTSNFGLISSSKATETPAVKSESITQVSTKSNNAKTVTSAPFSTVSAASVFAFGNTSVASTTTTSSTFSFFPATSTTSATVNSVFSFGTSSASQASKPISSVTTASSVFTFGSSSTSAPTSKPGGFTFKTHEKPQSTATVPPASQPTAQGLLPDISASATAPASSGGFVFGAAKTEPQSAASAPFTFGSGAPPSSSASAFSAFQPSQPANPTFQFGSQPPQSSASTFGSTTFSFGKTEAVNQIPSSTPQNTAAAFGQSTINFSFGSKTETPSQAGSVPQPSGFLASTNNFSFANKNEMPNAASQTPAPAFGSNIQPVFGNSTVPAFGTSEKPAQSGFSSFGTPSVFQFGTTNTDKKPAAPSSGFAFGTPVASETNSFSAGFNINTPPSFNFGATSTPAGAAPFQFAASSTDAATNQPRKYRKAVRRVTRKD